MATHNQVYNKVDFGEHCPDKNLPWVFETEDADFFFATEDEACAMQRSFRAEHGLCPYCGEPIAH